MGGAARHRFMQGIWLMLVGLLIAGSALVLGFLVAPDAKGFEGDSYGLFSGMSHLLDFILTFGMLFVGSLNWFWKRTEWG